MRAMLARVEAETNSVIRPQAALFSVIPTFFSVIPTGAEGSRLVLEALQRISALALMSPRSARHRIGLGGQTRDWAGTSARAAMREFR